MITVPGNVRVWLATGHTDVRRGFRALSLLVQETLKRDPHGRLSKTLRNNPASRYREDAQPCTYYRAV
jgi:transposase